MSLRTVVLIRAGVVAALVIMAGLLSVKSRQVNEHQACLTALQTPSIGADLSAVCEPIIATNHQVAARSYACDAALTARPENTYGVNAACTLPVKTVQTERDVARGEAGRLTRTLNDERLQRDDVVARATAAATTQAERKARAAAALKAAPRDSDGLVVCDAECVRNRWGELASERP